MEGVAVGMGSATTSCFAPFFVTASFGTLPAIEIDERLIRRVFGGSIYPGAGIRLELLAEDTNWWNAVLDFCGNYEEDLAVWRGMINWFLRDSELLGARMVSIGDSKDPDIRGCVFPRLVVGLTAQGSLVGMCGYVAG
jgi:hypothetical protein